MTPDEALNVVAQACAAVSAPLATHQQLQQALTVLSDALHVETPTEK